jgi:glycine dehydrogenase
MVADLTGLPVANASLLDEATACAEAMVMAERVAKSKARGFFVDAACHPQNIAVMRTRAEPLGIEVIVGPPETLDPAAVFGAIFQYPGTYGHLPIRPTPSRRCMLRRRWRSWRRIFWR